MLTKFLKLLLVRGVNKKIEKIAKEDPKVRGAILNMSKASDEAREAMAKYKEFDKYFN
tara:strand:+ start:1086 stop:1259 length:174 start_codon:yes stop_codon:yes gene_type:complete